jgi:hypothetical protein
MLRPLSNSAPATRLISKRRHLIRAMVGVSRGRLMAGCSYIFLLVPIERRPGPESVPVYAWSILLYKATDAF